jgi:transmembrane sensor
MTKDYREPEDLLSDESFLTWYFESGQGEAEKENGPQGEAAQEDGAWDHWIGENPDRKELVDRAIALLDSTRMQEKPVSAIRLQQAEEALLKRIDDRTAVIPFYRNWRWVAAACILAVLATGMVVVRMLPSRPQLVTPYGQLTVQRLPDGSEVTMNANSRLRYFNTWQDGTDREVWIEGEAFFHVSKTRLKSRFVVHTDRFDIVVTGTQFNVVNRHGEANIMLREGSVILHSHEGENMNMVPGDFVQWDQTRLEKTAVKSDSLLAWREHRLFFDKTPLKEVAKIIEEQYGVQVLLENQTIADSTITGIMRNDNLDVLLQALQITSEFDVERSNGTITIKASSH